VEISRAAAGEVDEINGAWAIVSEYYDAVSVAVREDRGAFEHEYFADGAGVWVARFGSDVAGCIALRRLEAFPHAGEIKRLYVKPEARGQGIAALLLTALEEYAAAAGYEWLYLDSKDDLKAAIRFYEKHGYQHCARYNDNPQATIFMRKRIGLQGS
jgi:ribosomal protein S18 acetylase RimI-like enzyme